jgi:hypothetical protein
MAIDSLHVEKLNEITENECLIPMLKKEKSQLKKLLSKNITIEKRLDTLDRLYEVKQQIAKFKNARNKYYLENCHNIFGYYENKEKQLNNSNEKQQLNSFFNIKPPEEEIENNHSADYLYRVKGIFEMEKVDASMCSCSGEMILTDGCMICNQCFCQHKVIEQIPNHDVEERETSNSYKKLNHFKEILKQVQGKETYTIKEEDIQTLVEHIRKYRLDMETIDVLHMKRILQKLKMKHLYDHVNLVRSKLGLPVLLMPSQLEEKLINMFILIQPHYKNYVPKHKTNFLNYHYVLFKMCELFEEKEYLGSFFMLKEREKILESDAIWSQICQEMEWQFIPTI